MSGRCRSTASTAAVENPAPAPRHAVHDVSDDFDDERDARDLCTWTRSDSPPAVEQAIRDQLNRRPTAAATGAEPSVPNVALAADHAVPVSEVGIVYIFVAGFGRLPAKCVNGKRRLLEPLPREASSQSSMLARPPPQPHRQVRSSPFVGSPQPPALAASSSSSAASPAAASAAPVNPPPGPLELPLHADSDSEDSAEEECDSTLDVPFPLMHHLSYLPYTIARRLRRSLAVGIGDEWCRTISFKVFPDQVMPLSIQRIDGERARLGNTRFKIGITHSPIWRFIAAPYAYVRESPPWGSMQVLWVSDKPGDASTLERDLITHYKETKAKGLCNIKPGGESCPKFPPVFVYCVFSRGPHGGSHAARSYMIERANQRARCGRCVGSTRSRRYENLGCTCTHRYQNHYALSLRHLVSLMQLALLAPFLLKSQVGHHGPPPASRILSHVISSRSLQCHLCHHERLYRPGIPQRPSRRHP